MSSTCYCGATLSYQSCCEPLHKGSPAPHAEALMRSRYSAFVLQLEPYLLSSWHKSKRPKQLDLEEAPHCQWMGLVVKQHTIIDAHHATVAFSAQYRINHQVHVMHETSRFVQENGHWYYVDGNGHQDK